MSCSCGLEGVEFVGYVFWRSCFFFGGGGSMIVVAGVVCRYRVCFDGMGWVITRCPSTTGVIYIFPKTYIQ